MTLEEKYGPIPFEVNDWGSCQYSSARWLYDLYFKLREESSFEEVLESLNIKASFTRRVDFNTIKHGFETTSMRNGMTSTQIGKMMWQTISER